MRKTVTLIKKNGKTFSGICANIHPTRIFTQDGRALVEKEDIFVYVLPEGTEERYVVLDRGFWSARGSFPDHYQIPVRKATIVQEAAIDAQVPSKCAYESCGLNLRGRMSTSALPVKTRNSENVFAALKRAIELHVPQDGSQDVLLGRVKALEQAEGTKGYLHRYQEFISAAADHITSVAPFLPPLTHLLGDGI